MRSKLLVLTALVLLVGAIPATAQYQQDPLDLGAADTVDLAFSVVPDYTTGKVHLQADLYVFNDANIFTGTSMGLSWDNPNLQMDSAKESPFTETWFDLGRFFFEDSDLGLTNTNQRFIFGGASLFSGGLQPQPTRQLWASYYFTVSTWGTCDSINIDTLTFSGGSDYRMALVGGGFYRPFWAGPESTRDTSCVISANLTVAPDSLHFGGVEGGSAPPLQSFNIGTDGASVSFTASETVSWMSLSPTIGSTPQTVTVMPNIIGLSAGTYLDSIQVSSGDAANSPLWVKISLTLDPPPPTIGYAPDEFFFNAVAGGANPAAKTLTISNTGGSTLNWTVAHTESWLTLAPGSGTGGGDVTLSVDITGLAFDDYVDTIVVTDPNATNSPVLVSVYLSVGSDLPVISVDPLFNFVPVPTSSRAVDPRTIKIRNDGAGTMNFWTEENSTRLLTVTPASGTAPEDVEVGFKLTSGSAGDDFFDTLWVFSNEAINSPVPVVFQFHLTDNPAQLYVSADTADLSLYECGMGMQVLMPTVSILVQNFGGDDPMAFEIFGESDLFDIQQLSSVAPASVTLVSKYIGLPLGVYFDTLVFVAQTAINPVDTVIVRYEIIEGVDQPKIWVSNFSYTFQAQEGKGPVPGIALDIRNQFGGCMDWYMIENVPFMFPDDTSGTAPSSVNFGVDPTGFTLGEYRDSLKIYAPGASNSPGTIRLTLQMWRFVADVNWSGEINVTDMVYMVAYLFEQGPGPKPTLFVGDLNCDHFVNVADLTYFVAYMFQQGPMPCGNPYK